MAPRSFSRERTYSAIEDDVPCDVEADRSAVDNNRDQVSDAIGSFGKWQLIKSVMIISVIWWPGTFHLLNMVFFRAETDFWCSRPPLYSNWSVDEWKNFSSPSKSRNGLFLNDGSYDTCQVYDLDFNNLYEQYKGNESLIKASINYTTAVKNHQLRKCDSWEYDHSFWRSTIIQEWDLVCDREDLQKLTQQSTFFGLLSGVFISGIISDRFGRVPTMLGMIIVTLIFGTVSSVIPTYEWFLVCIWFCGFTVIGFGTVAYCWMMELLSGRTKTILGCAQELNYAFWGLLTVGIAYLIPDWHQMQLVFTLPLVILLGAYWVLPESPKWLIAHGKIDEAEKILRKIAIYNGKPLPLDFKVRPVEQPNVPQSTKGRGILGFLDLFRTPNIRKNTIIIYYVWFSSSIVYYGLTLNSNEFGASVFVYMSIGKVIEIPFNLLVMFMVLKMGRRISAFCLLAVCGVALIGTMLIPTGVFAYEWPIVALNIFGRGASIGALSICYVYSAELFPTVVRNVGIGSSSLWARVSPMIAPYVADLAVYEPRLPILIFGIIAIIASFLVCFLPETAHHKLPDSIEEAEMLGQGDTLFVAARKWFKRRSRSSDSETECLVSR